MKRLFHSLNSFEAESLKDLLERDGIAAAVVAPMSPLSGEGAIVFEGTPEVWVNDEDFGRALEVKKDWLLQL